LEGSCKQKAFTGKGPPGSRWEDDVATCLPTAQGEREGGSKRGKHFGDGHMFAKKREILHELIWRR